MIKKYKPKNMHHSDRPHSGSRPKRHPKRNPEVNQFNRNLFKTFSEMNLLKTSSGIQVTNPIRSIRSPRRNTRKGIKRFKRYLNPVNILRNIKKNIFKQLKYKTGQNIRIKYIRKGKKYHKIRWNIKPIIYKLSLDYNRQFKPTILTTSRYFFLKYLNKYKKKTLKIFKKYSSIRSFYSTKAKNIRNLVKSTYIVFLNKLKKSNDLLVPKLFNHLKFNLSKNIIKKCIIAVAKVKTLSHLKNIKLELAKILEKCLKSTKFLNRIKLAIGNNLFNKNLEDLIKKRKKRFIAKFKLIKNFKKWFIKYRLLIKRQQEILINLKNKKKQEYSANYHLLKTRFNNSLTKFIAFKKAKAKALKKRMKNRVYKLNVLFYRLKTLHKKATTTIFRKISLFKLNTSFQRYKNLLKSNYELKPVKASLFTLLKRFRNVSRSSKSIKIKLAFISKRVLKLVLMSLTNIKNNSKIGLVSKLDTFNSFILNLFYKYRNFSLQRFKRDSLILKKLDTLTSFQNTIHNLNLTKDKAIITKNYFKRYMTNNALFEKMNLKNNLEVLSSFRNTSDILRADHFTSLLNKEQAYFETFYQDQNPLKLLTTITGHNIYLTLFVSKPYQILWKASAGMLGLKHFRRAKKHQMTFKDLIIRCQLFMARNRALLQRPLHLFIRHLNYHGTKNLLSFFVNQQKPSTNFENYKNLKIYNFYKQAPHLCNNYAFQFMSMIWSRMKNNLRRLKHKTLYQIINKQKLKVKALNTPSGYKNKRINLTLKPKVDKFFNKNPFINVA